MACNSKCSKNVWSLQRALNNFLFKLNQVNSIEKDKKQQDYNSCHLFLLLGCAFFMGKITSGSLLLHMRQCNTWPYVANQDVFFQATRKHTKSCLYQPNLLPLSLLHCPENFADTSWANFTFIWYIKYHCRALGRRRMKLLKSLVFLIHEVSNTVCILELLKWRFGKSRMCFFKELSST